MFVTTQASGYLKRKEDSSQHSYPLYQHPVLSNMVSGGATSGGTATTTTTGHHFSAEPHHQQTVTSVNGTSSSHHGGHNVVTLAGSKQYNVVNKNSSGDHQHKKDFSVAPRTGVVGGFNQQTYVGFANIPNQVFRRAIKQGFDFTMMVVGDTGLGKSTFINSLFLTDIYPECHSGGRLRTVSIDSHPFRLIEKGVTLNLTLVDTPGFGDALDNSKCWEPIIQFVDKNYWDYFHAEAKIERKERIVDKRVHLCLYFIPPTGHGLRQLDIEFMKQLHDRVNVIPVIAKADTMTAEELHAFKKQISNDLETNGIKVYKFMEPDEEDEKKEFEKLRERVPFAVVGSNMVKEENGKKVRYRQYAWGTVEVENMDHNDFLALRQMILQKNLIDLVEVTKHVHYENFRLRQMTKLTKTSLDRDPFTEMEKEKQKKERELADKKLQMEAVFEEKVRNRERKILEKEEKMKYDDEKRSKQLEEKRAELERAKTGLLELKRLNPGLVSTMDSRTSIHSAADNSSPPDGDKKKKSNTLGNVFGRLH